MRIKFLLILFFLTGCASLKTNLSDDAAIHEPIQTSNLTISTTKSAEVIAKDKETQKESWKLALSNEILTPPLLIKDTLVVKTIDGHLTALDILKGKVRWVYRHPIPEIVLRKSSPVTVSNETLVTGFSDGRIVAINLKTGKLKWEKEIEYSWMREDYNKVEIASRPEIKNGIVYIASYQGNLAALQLSNGKLLWKYPVSSYNNLALIDNMIILVDTNSNIWAFDQETGGVIWKQDKFKGEELDSPYIKNHHIFIADSKNKTYRLDKFDGATHKT